MVPCYPLSPYTSICFFTRTNAISKNTSPPPLPSVFFNFGWHVMPHLMRHPGSVFLDSCFCRNDIFRGSLLILTPHPSLSPRRGEGESEGGSKLLCALGNEMAFVLRIGEGRGEDFLKRPIGYGATSLYRLPPILGSLFEGPREQKKSGRRSPRGGSNRTPFAAIL